MFALSLTDNFQAATCFQLRKHQARARRGSLPSTGRVAGTCGLLIDLSGGRGTKMRKSTLLKALLAGIASTALLTATTPAFAQRGGGHGGGGFGGFHGGGGGG